MNIETEFLSQAALDYSRVEKAITWLQQHAPEQPDLASAARAVHLSEFHFQRLFQRWVGISPKRFLQFVTVESAKQQLSDSRSVLDTALDSGLSGPGRLHDLFVSVEAATPGEFKSRGAGLRVESGFHPTPFGQCLLAATTRGVCWLSFLNGGGERAALREMKTHWSGAAHEEASQKTGAIARRIFSSIDKQPATPLSLLLMGTNFQLQVWRALLRIPEGAVTTYAELGASIGAPKAARAIGAAVGANPISYLIPCHRVIRRTGMLGGYRWGEPRKRALLGWEAAKLTLI